MAELKTKENDASVADFLASVTHEKRRADTETVVAMMERVTGCPAKMWGKSIIGFDTYAYKYESGRSGDWMITGVSPRKASLTIYITPGFKKYAGLMAKLGKHKNSVSCLYINKLEDIDMDVLEELVATSVADMRAKYPR